MHGGSTPGPYVAVLAERDLGLVRVERTGRYVRYGLDLAAVERLGRDVAVAPQY
ncbi:hypothetical protein ACFU6S_40935 [Streptomyces sp. NPDC057456]|uniref:hypothetical protein n=1 Tax=Streptomyces sp. NPDC057456 TaxID=3346139 RepID=UPI00368CA2F6